MKPLKKVRNEIAKKETQLALLQSELKDLKAQEQQLENAEMIAAIRNTKFSADDMLMIIKALKNGTADLSSLLPLVDMTEDTATESEVKNYVENETL